MERPWQITSETDWLQSCREVVLAAQGILDGSVEFTAGLRALCGLKFIVRAGHDPDFLFIIGVDSELDRWHVSEEMKAHYRPEVEATCQRLVENYGNPERAFPAQERL